MLFNFIIFLLVLYHAVLQLVDKPINIWLSKVKQNLLNYEQRHKVKCVVLLNYDFLMFGN